MTTTQSPPSPRPRLLSLDALRGFTVAWMIVVNTSGDSRHTFHQLAHSKWNGCTVADVIFPCFLFMVGIASQLAIGSRLKRNTPKGEIFVAALKRSALLFLFGLAVNGFPFFDLHTLRIYGVLQRIAVCYLLCVVLLMYCRTRALSAVTGGILVAYWIAMCWVPVPGFGMPGVEVPFLDPHGNLAAWLDRLLIPQAHLYHQGFYDPEGLLSDLPALATTLLGALAGGWMQKGREHRRTATGLLIAAAALIAVALLWSHWFPFNKRLWTSSFALFAGGVSVFLLWCFYRFLDGSQRQGTPAWLVPLLAFGTNALPAYILSEFLASALSAFHVGSGMTAQQWLYRPFSAVFSNASVAALAYAVVFAAVCYLPIHVLYRRQIFLKV